ncbi:MAG: hypothetical protein KME29_19225 [Calothrix sp. FI2-JRJ7]|jgi:hypothetical protein|nr:hypothetical protein [Calothrix sp. FI2-JRJ7]
MTKPDFNKMTRQEIRAYLLANRDDDDATDEAIDVLVKTGNFSEKYPYPQTDEDLKNMNEILKNYLKKSKAINFCTSCGTRIPACFLIVHIMTTNP